MTRFTIKHSNPEGLFDSEFYSQVVTVSGNAKIIYIGGQNAINSKGELVGRDDFELQTKQALLNIKTALASQNATFDDVIKLNIYMAQGCDPAIGFKAFGEIVGKINKPPLITVLKVAGFANPQFLIEIDAIAAVEDKGE